MTLVRGWEQFALANGLDGDGSPAGVARRVRLEQSYRAGYEAARRGRPRRTESDGTPDGVVALATWNAGYDAAAPATE